MQYAPPRFLFVLSLIAIFLHAEAAVDGRSHVRKYEIPKRIGRAADPHVEASGPAIRLQPAKFPLISGFIAYVPVRSRPQRKHRRVSALLRQREHSRRECGFEHRLCD